MDKHEVARILDEIGVLLSLKNENSFRIRAYHNAARAVENLDEDLELLVREERLEDVPGIGAHSAEKIATLVATGKLPYYENLKKSIPSGLLELLKVPGLGAKKVQILYQKLKIKTTQDLIDACKKGRVAKLAGFGDKTQEKILSGLTQIKRYGKRMLWWDAMQAAKFILKGLSKLKAVEKVELAGSLRRKLETIGDLDFLVATSSPKAVIDWFVTQHWVSSVISKGASKASIRLSKSGQQVDLRVIPKEQFPFALMYFTGSKEHNIHMRQRTLAKGFSLSEYGFEPTGKKMALKLPQKLSSEEEIFNFLGLDYIPPELREDMGEIDAAEKGKLPTLVEEKDIRGVFHCHTTDSDGHNTLEEMVRGAQELGWEYIGIADHSKSSYQANGMDEKRLLAQAERIQKLNRSKKFSTHIFAGVECDILTNGSLDFPNSILKELDYVIVAIHRSFQLDEKKMTARLIKAIENPYTTMVAHPTGRLLLRREPYTINIPKIIDAAIANGKIIELNAQPMRLDMDWRQWHKAKEKGLKCSINPDAHSVYDLQYFRAGINCARKGWLEKRDVINTLTLAKMTALLKK